MESSSLVFNSPEKGMPTAEDRMTIFGGNLISFASPTSLLNARAAGHCNNHSVVNQPISLLDLDTVVVNSPPQSCNIAAAPTEEQMLSETSSGPFGATINHSHWTCTKRKFKDVKESCVSTRNHLQEIFTSMSTDFSRFSTDIVEAVTNLQKHTDSINRKYSIVDKERKELMDQILDLKGNIRVFCRARPLPADSKSAVEFPGENGLCVLNGKTKKMYKFDKVFDYGTDQLSIFEEVKPLVTSVMDGYNVCILAYGQTGSGKTYTMEGSPSNRGVNYRSLAELFAMIDARKETHSYTVSVSVLEIYCEQIRDLLDPGASASEQDKKFVFGSSVNQNDGKKLDIRQGPNGMFVTDLTEENVASVEDVWSVMNKGYSFRAAGATMANDVSSRSHCLLYVTVVGENKMTGVRTFGKLVLVDLAGSERISKTEASGERLKEAQAINKSLSALGDVIEAITSKNNHVPFRNSKLTYLLQDCLGSNSRTLMFVQISPLTENVSETICSLNFATRVRSIELGACKKKEEAMETGKIRQLLEKAQDEVRAKTQTCDQLRQELTSALEQLKDKQETLIHLNETLRAKSREVDSALEAKIKSEMELREKEKIINALRKENASLVYQLNKRKAAATSSTTAPTAATTIMEVDHSEGIVKADRAPELELPVSKKPKSFKYNAAAVVPVTQPAAVEQVAAPVVNDTTTTAAQEVVDKSCKLLSSPVRKMPSLEPVVVAEENNGDSSRSYRCTPHKPNNEDALAEAPLDSNENADILSADANTEAESVDVHVTHQQATVARSCIKSRVPTNGPLQNITWQTNAQIAVQQTENPGKRKRVTWDVEDDTENGPNVMEQHTSHNVSSGTRPTPAAAAASNNGVTTRASSKKQRTLGLPARVALPTTPRAMKSAPTRVLSSKSWRI
eukprot:GILJ01011021.1.p1 GENE.GILJ01011021.1~~GILJ01011021.1.p1  ORF type:complete len:923 (-),score=152.56 GILJ01011021.1:106-2829(-)